MVELKTAVAVVIEAMQKDPDYAWSWHCNIAMAFVDSGVDRYKANQGAAEFMRRFANVHPAHALPPPSVPKCMAHYCQRSPDGSCDRCRVSGN